VYRKALSDSVKDGCVVTCRDFLNQELPDLANQYLARYLAVQIDRDLPETARTLRGEYRVIEDSDRHQCVRVITSDAGEHSVIILGLNLSREGTVEAVERLKGSEAEEKLLVYLFSFESVGDEGIISEAIMEGELLHMVRGTGITAFFAMLDARAGMGMMARIDGDMRTIEYIPY
jgi:hypothetical protein